MISTGKRWFLSRSRRTSLFIYQVSHTIWLLNKLTIPNGSCARGTEAPESDIDLIVLLEGPVDGPQEIRRMWEVLYPLQLESDRLLSVVPVDIALYIQGEYALYRQAKAEGVTL